MRPASFVQSITPPRLTATSLTSVAMTALTGLAIGAAIVSKPLLVAGLAAIALAVIGIVVALSYPAAAFIGLILLTALVPTYAAPAIGPFLFVPAAAASWLLAVVLGWRNVLTQGRVFRPTIIDFGTGAFVLLMAISIAFSARASRNEYLHLMFLWAGPYLAARLLLADTKRPTMVIAISFALATAILAPIAVAEYAGASNPFHALDFNPAEFAVWSGQAERFGQARAEASFGHPIALSMFVATSALLSLAMALNAKSRRERNVWYASVALSIGIQIVTVSRTGWLMLAIGVFMIVLVSIRGAQRGRLIALLTAVGLTVLVASVVVPSALQILPGFEKTESSIQSSSDYRQALLTRALEPGVLHSWGNPVNKVTPFVNFSTATDNAYILLADMWGLIPTAALFFIALGLLLIIMRSSSIDTEALVALPTVAFAGLVALFFVAFITQQQIVIWLLLGAASVSAERLSSARRRKTTQRSEAAFARM